MHKCEQAINGHCHRLHLNDTINKIVMFDWKFALLDGRIGFLFEKFVARAGNKKKNVGMEKKRQVTLLYNLNCKH